MTKWIQGDTIKLGVIDLGKNERSLGILMWSFVLYFRLFRFFRFYLKKI